MKSNALTTLLQGALAFSVLFSLMMCIRLIVHTRDVRMYNAQIQRINAANNTVQMMVNDCVTYSRKNPAIEPILASIQNPNAAATKQGAR
jgi:hypothetical protein